jgi:hypothetical protein
MANSIYNFLWSIVYLALQIEPYGLMVFFGCIANNITPDINTPIPAILNTRSNAMPISFK